MVSAGVLSQETSDNIVAFYATKENQQSQRQTVAFAIIGAILVGLGIILIVAHNWDNLARPVKVFFSFLPLVAGQFICGWVLWKQSGKQGWQEASAAFLFFAVGASIALVSQVYNIPGDLRDFLFTWLLLTFPLVYIMSSSMVSLLFIAVLTVYGANAGYGAAETSHYWWMLLLILPHYATMLHKSPGSNFTLFHNWFIPLSLTICLGTVARNADTYLFLPYVNMFAVFYLLGLTKYFQAKNLLANSYLVIGALGTVILLLITSFHEVWLGMEQDSRPAMPHIIAIVVSFIAAVYLLYRNIQSGDVAPTNVLAFAFIVFLFAFVFAAGMPVLTAVLINILVLGVAISTMQRGLQLNHLGILNFGLLITTVLAACRFFDTDISFVLRGLMFLAGGVGFFVANNMLLKKRRQHA